MSNLVGVGVGPGDPGLVTLKAVHIFETADVILVPAADTRDAEAGRAEAIVTEVCPGAAGRIRRIPFSMAARSGVDERRSQAWMASAIQAVSAFEAGARLVAFATIGDPSVYSTFSYLASEVRARIPDCQVSVVPGITAMQALAAASVTPLAEGQEVLALVPVTAGLETLDRALDCADTVVAYKVGRHLGDVTALLRERHRDEGAVLGVDVGLPDQTIVPLADAQDAPYFSSLIIPPVRTQTGGRL